jgi:hypothetical protein
MPVNHGIHQPRFAQPSALRRPPAITLSHGRRQGERPTEPGLWALILVDSGQRDRPGEKANLAQLGSY